jgi:hypothetical protein
MCEDRQQEDVMTGRPDPTIGEHSGKFLDVLNSLNFGPLAYKLMHPEDGPGLSLDQTTDAITKYKCFLFLYRACEGGRVVNLVEIADGGHLQW